MTVHSRSCGDLQQGFFRVGLNRHVGGRCVVGVERRLVGQLHRQLGRPAKWGGSAAARWAVGLGRVVKVEHVDHEPAVELSTGEDPGRPALQRSRVAGGQGFLERVASGERIQPARQIIRNRERAHGRGVTEQISMFTDEAIQRRKLGRRGVVPVRPPFPACSTTDDAAPSIADPYSIRGRSTLWPD